MYIAMEFCETPDGGVAASHDSLVENMVQGNTMVCVSTVQPSLNLEFLST